MKAVVQREGDVPANCRMMVARAMAPNLAFPLPDSWAPWQRAVDGACFDRRSLAEDKTDFAPSV
jgi:hypothetical protein